MSTREDLRALAADIRRAGLRVKFVENEYLHVTEQGDVWACPLGSLVYLHFNGEVPDGYNEGKYNRLADAKAADGDDEGMDALHDEHSRCVERILNLVWRIHPVLRRTDIHCLDCKVFHETNGRTHVIQPLYDVIIHLASRHSYTFELVVAWLEQYAEVWEDK